MKTLVYDTETTGFIQKSLPDEHPLQPHLVQLGAVLYEGRIPRATVSMIVKPEGWTIPDGAASAHGITTEIAMAVGIPRQIVIATFTNLRAIVDRIVCHNLAFDQKVMASNIARMGKQPAHDGPSQYYCTMDLSAPICNLPPTAKMLAAGFNKPKAPKLEEAYEFFFKEKFVGAHDALVDAQGAGRVFWELVEPWSYKMSRREVVVRLLVVDTSSNAAQVALMPFDSPQDQDIFTSYIAQFCLQLLKEYKASATVGAVRKDLNKLVPNPELH